MPRMEKSKPVAGGGKQKDDGKYFELPGAVEGEVVVRFAPEATGYLHIGHASEALLNSHYQRLYKGKLVFRFDDTNPETEKESFEKIIEEIEILGIKPDQQSYTSDWFELMLGKAVEMIKNDKAYVDDTPPEQMKTEREQKIASQNRDNSIEKNLSMWKEMVAGSEIAQMYCLRAKIDMTSDNGCLRDPTIYRCKPQEHPKTGYKYKVYPTYDFACPIVDRAEGITHALRTSEYMDRDHQFNWFCDAMGFVKSVKLVPYSKLNLWNTVLSTPALTYFVQKGIVDGWDDPRMPTVRGFIRRGLTVEGLQQFIASHDFSIGEVPIEWDKIWAFNRKVIDKIVYQYSAVEVDNAVPVILEDTIAAGASINVALHLKLPEAGTRAVPLGSRLLIDQSDAKLIAPDTVVFFINWGNVVITRVKKNADGLVTSINGKLNLENKDFKEETLKIMWLESQSTIPALLLYFDHIIKKPVLGKDDDFKAFINRDSRFCVQAHVDLAVKDLKKGSIIQIQAKGSFIIDEPHSSLGKQVRLIELPDGKTNFYRELLVSNDTVSTMGNLMEKYEQEVESLKATLLLLKVCRKPVDSIRLLNDLGVPLTPLVYPDHRN